MSRWLTISQFAERRGRTVRWVRWRMENGAPHIPGRRGRGGSAKINPTAWAAWESRNGINVAESTTVGIPALGSRADNVLARLPTAVGERFERAFRAGELSSSAVAPGLKPGDAARIVVYLAAVMTHVQEEEMLAAGLPVPEFDLPECLKLTSRQF